MFLVNPSGLFKHTARANGSVTLLKATYSWPCVNTWSDRRSPHCWLSTLSLLTVDQQSTVLIINHLTVDCQSTVNSVDCQLPHCWPLTLSLLTVDLPPLGSTVNSVDHWSPHCWLSTLSLLTVDPPHPPHDQHKICSRKMITLLARCPTLYSLVYWFFWYARYFKQGKSSLHICFSKLKSTLEDNSFSNFSLQNLQKI